MRSLANRERQKARKILVWHQLRQAGVSFRSIAGDCGLSHVTIRTYTSPEWVEWARGVLSGGKAETAPGLN